MIRVLTEGTRAREAWGIVIACGALLITIALASYSPDDPSLLVSGGGHPSNWIGPFGAQVSAALFAAFGLAAWFLPLTMVAAALRRFRPGQGALRRSAVIGLVIVANSTAVLLALIARNIDYRGAALPAGGLLGYLLGAALKSALSDVGSLLVAGTTLLVGLTLAARSSLADATGTAIDVGRRTAKKVPRPSGSRIRGAFAALRSALAALRPRWPAFLKRRAAVPADAEAAAETARGGRGDKALARLKGRLVPRRDDDDEEDEELADEAGLPLADDLVEDGEEEEDEEEEVDEEEDEEDEEDEDEAEEAEEPAPRTRRARKPVPKLVPRQGKLPVEILPASAKLPPIELLAPSPPRTPPDRKELVAIARAIESRCAEFAVDGQVTEFHPGPVVTTFEFRPNAGIKLARITALADDLALGLEAETVRLDRIPGRSSVGIEVPNKQRERIALREILEADAFRRSGDILTVALGKTQEGDISVGSLAKMPHLLVAGATGSGKSVGLNGIITSILYRARPDQVKFILIDPKMLELGLYEGIPHLLVPVVTDMKQAGNALKWAVREMERRYRLLAACNTRHLDAFNKIAENSPSTVEKAIQTIPARGEGEKYEAKTLPYVIIVVDELADMLMTTGQETEEAIARLAQKARAVGIHLVLATQRPSVDVLTGSIKANFPARIAYRVASKIDSRTILDASGAERLLGAGDMLYRQPGSARLQRVHGAYVSEDENLRVVQWLKGQAKAEYDKSILEDPPDPAAADDEGGSDFASNDPMYEKAVRLVVATGQASTSFLQRRMRLGYSRAARIIDQMEQDEVIGPADGSRPRQVLVDSDFLSRLDQKAEEERD